MHWEDLMVEAYILVQTEVGKAADVATHIGKIAGVTQAEDVTGPYDVIGRAHADNVDELGRQGGAAGAEPEGRRAAQVGGRVHVPAQPGYATEIKLHRAARRVAGPR